MFYFQQPLKAIAEPGVGVTVFIEDIENFLAWDIVTKHILQVVANVVCVHHFIGFANGRCRYEMILEF